MAVAASESKAMTMEERVAALENELAELKDDRQEKLRQLENEGSSTAQRQEQAAEVEHELVATGTENQSTLVAGWDRGFFLGSADNRFRLEITGWIQPRFEYRSRPDAEDTSSFLMRRVRLDFRGHVFDERITFRVMPELARTANLRDAWIDYEWNRAFQVRAGQFTVPFQWHRYVSPRRQHFAERGDPSETFGFPTGRDIGVMAHGRNEDNTFGYGVGVFDGAGRNVGISNSSGNMGSARVTWAALGELPREESDLGFSDQLQLSFLGGVQGAYRNEARDWDLGRSPAPGNTRADWVSSTAGVGLRYRGFSQVLDGYLRRVDPDSPAVDSYSGWAYMASTGYFVVPEKWELVGRWSQLRLDKDDRDTRQDELGLGVNWYVKGHDHKIRLNYFNGRSADGTEHTTVLEYHLQF